MGAQTEIVGLLRNEFLDRQLRNPSYSMRAFARAIKVSPSAISEILNTGRPVTKRMGRKILQGLCVAPDRADTVLASLPIRHGKEYREKVKAATADSFVEIRSADFDLISNWYYFGILSLIHTAGFQSDSSWIAKRLGISKAEAAKAVQTLLQLNLIKKTKQGKFKPTGQEFKTTRDVAAVSIRKNHLQHLDLLRNSLEQDAIEKRDFSSVTLTFDPDEMMMAKELIKTFRRSFTAKAEKTKKKEVFNLSIQFIQLSKDDTND